MTTRQFSVYAILFTLTLAVTLFIFWPALTGPFLLDDTVNLEAMGKGGGITSYERLIDFIFSFGSEFGRVLSMLSFVINDQHWPGDSWSFKYTNLLIHLLNGILIFVLSRQLCRYITPDLQRVHWVALATMALWLLHPIQLSTMMTVVQRMTQLMMLFSLLGLICFIRGREIVVRRGVQGYLWMSAGIGLGGLFSVLSKENGILLPLYALILEGTIIRAAGLPKPAYWRIWSSIFLAFPLLALVLATVFSVDMHSGSIYQIRDFTPMERVLTEARVLVDYVHLIVMPSLGGTGLFHDDYPISHGLFDPPSTMAAIVFWFVLGVGAFILRKRFPVLAFAVLWFLAGHSLESSIIGLEIYFEHRNYLPMLGITFAGAYYLLISTEKLRPITVSVLILIIGGYCFLSYQSSIIWGDRALLTKVWVEENPTSLRAQQSAAIFWRELGDNDKTLEHLQLGIKYNQDSVGMKCQITMLKCEMNDLSNEEFNELVEIARVGEFNAITLDCIDRLQKLFKEEICPVLTFESYNTLMEALLENPVYNYPRSLQEIYYLKGVIGGQRRDLNEAMENLDKAYQATPNVDIALAQTTLLASAGLYDDALDYVQIARNGAYKTNLVSYVKYWLLPFDDKIDKVEQAILQIKKTATEKNEN